MDILKFSDNFLLQLNCGAS